MMDAPEMFSFTAAAGGERLDKLIVAEMGERLTRSQIQALIKDGFVTIDNQPAKSGWRLKGGETITIIIPPRPRDETVQPAIIPLEVIYEDTGLAVINKPASMVVHPGAGGETGTLVNAILALYPEIGEMSYAARRRGIVHRLDKDTSGVILIARNDLALRRLMVQFQRRTVDKRYIALLERLPKTRTGRINVPIDRDPVQRKKMSVQRSGHSAITEFEIAEQFDGGFTLVDLKLLTGRTHQIRVHMAFIGCPIVGDRTYGFRKQRLPLRRQFLHAAALTFDHPTTGERLRFESPLPADLQTILDNLRSGT
jgi:23S rRNA pseudouridine1911/1915/1917 synthase